MSDSFKNITEIFGEDVFNDTAMRERLPKKVYQSLRRAIEEGSELSFETADVIAHEMKEWAIERGATHYTHWFQPLTGATAEKHDSFISAPLPSGKVLMSLSGKKADHLRRLLMGLRLSEDPAVTGNHRVRPDHNNCFTGRFFL